MQIDIVKNSIIILILYVILHAFPLMADEKTQTVQDATAQKEAPKKLPDLAEIVPLATELTARLAALESNLKNMVAPNEVEISINSIEGNLREPAARLQRLKDSKGYKYNKLVELRDVIRQEGKLFDEVSKPIGENIRQLEKWREGWQAEKTRWTDWQSSLVEEDRFDQLSTTFEKAHLSIDRALELILPQLVGILALQEKAAGIETKWAALDSELASLIEEERRDALLNASPTMFSSQYLSQLSSVKIWPTLQKGLDGVTRSIGRFLGSYGWIVFIQALVSLFAMIALYRNSQVLRPSEQWGFLAARPIAAGFFMGFMATDWIYEYMAAPGAWKVVSTMIGAVSFSRLSGFLVAARWKKQLVYGLMTVLIITRLMEELSMPLPLFRLYTVLAALAGIIIFMRWAAQKGQPDDPALYRWSLRSGALVLSIVFVAEIWGKNALSTYLFVSLVHSLAIALVFMLITYLIRGGLEWLFRISPLRKASVLIDEKADAIVGKITRLVDTLVWGMVFVPGLLMVWGVYDNLLEATRGLLAFGFTLGSHRISVGLLLVSAGIVYGSFLASWILQKLLVEALLSKRGVEKGVRLSIARLVHYTVLLIGFLYALATLGLEVTKLTIMLSALGVGIGFGLQNVVNNFFSGLILLFERPIRVGDIIEFDGKWAEVQRIGLRATTVQDFNKADIIIPNGDLIANQVTNWTLSNRQVRLIIPVGVAYGSDVPLAMETLAACAKGQRWVVPTRPPQVLFLGFGESSLDFELRIWTTDADHRLEVSSNIHQEIDRRFRELGIEIAFPQRDLHLRSVDASAALRLTTAGEKTAESKK